MLAENAEAPVYCLVCGVEQVDHVSSDSPSLEPGCAVGFGGGFGCCRSRLLNQTQLIVGQRRPSSSPDVSSQSACSEAASGLMTKRRTGADGGDLDPRQPPPHLRVSTTSPFPNVPPLKSNYDQYQSTQSSTTSLCPTVPASPLPTGQWPPTTLFRPSPLFPRRAWKPFIPSSVADILQTHSPGQAQLT